MGWNSQSNLKILELTLPQEVRLHDLAEMREVNLDFKAILMILVDKSNSLQNMLLVLAWNIIKVLLGAIHQQL
jgi:hypothetical protein